MVVCHLLMKIFFSGSFLQFDHSAIQIKSIFLLTFDFLCLVFADHFRIGLVSTFCCRDPLFFFGGITANSFLIHICIFFVIHLKCPFCCRQTDLVIFFFFYFCFCIYHECFLPASVEDPCSPCCVFTCCITAGTLSQGTTSSPVLDCYGTFYQFTKTLKLTSFCHNCELGN